MTLPEILKKKKETITERWLEEIYAAYPENVSSFIKRQKDQFANPVGHALRKGAAAILDCLIEGWDADSIRGDLEEIIKIRALQCALPSQAVSFIHFLKNIVRTELVDYSHNQELYPQLTEFEDKLAQITLLAFDIYTKCREKIYELRVNEVKRNVSAIMRKFNNADTDSVVEQISGNINIE
ncbi:MAG: RsbRD N-terminal domain-containing protein [bacterium]